MQSITKKVFSRIYGHGRGWAFTQNDFFDLGEKDSIAQTLSRAAKKGTIRRLMHGLYDYPRYSQLLDKHIPPEMEQVAGALARKFRWTIIPEGSTALHILGLDTQVPAHYIYFSSGPNREYDILDRKIRFIHRKTSHTAIADHYAASLVQAIQSLGQGNVTNQHRQQLSALRTAQQYRNIVRNTRSVTAWIHDEIIAIAKYADQGESSK